MGVCSGGCLGSPGAGGHPLSRVARSVACPGVRARTSTEAGRRRTQTTAALTTGARRCGRPRDTGRASSADGAHADEGVASSPVCCLGRARCARREAGAFRVSQGRGCTGLPAASEGAPAGSRPPRPSPDRARAGRCPPLPNQVAAGGRHRRRRAPPLTQPSRRRAVHPASQWPR